MANDFFKNGDKAYSEILNDLLLVGNAFDWIINVSLPTDSGGVFPNSSTSIKANVADVSITPNSNLSIGSTIDNSSGSSQVYRLTVYPDFNRFGGFKSITLDGDGTFYIANKGGTTPIASNLDYDDLSNVPELKVLKEYDIVITIPNNGEVNGLDFVFQSTIPDVSANINIANVSGLIDELNKKVNVSDIKDNLTSTDVNKPLSAKQGKVLQDNKVDKVTGKGLSTNDFTDAYKEALDSNEWLLTTNENSTENSRITLYVNPFLRMVDFRYYRANYTFSSTSEVTISSITTVTNTKIGTINVKPITPTPLASYNTTIIGGVLTNGNMTVQTNSTGTKTINVRGMWHY